MKYNKVSIGIWAYGRCSERYVGDGYKPLMSFDDRLKNIAMLSGASGVEINYPNDIDEENFVKISKQISDLGLKVSTLNVELVCEPQWKNGSISSFDHAMRQLAIQRTKESMQIAKRLNCKTLNLWLGLDGFDYVFEADYPAAWSRLVDGIRECALSCPEVNIGIEYKLSEPNMRCYVNSSGKALALALATGCNNVGVTLDFGHAINANENPAEAAAFLLANNKLFHVHVNDNYGISDDDMPAGTSHWPQFFEFIYWLERLEYEGWISVDIYPYRDSAQTANQTTLDFIRLSEKVSANLDVKFYDGTNPKGEAISNLINLFTISPKGAKE